MPVVGKVNAHSPEALIHPQVSATALKHANVLTNTKGAPYCFILTEGYTWLVSSILVYDIENQHHKPTSRPTSYSHKLSTKDNGFRGRYTVLVSLPRLLQFEWIPLSLQKPVPYESWRLIMVPNTVDSITKS